MPKVKAGTLTMNYETEGTGEPLILLPFLAADHACYAFQVPEYAKHFTCISVDLRGSGETDKPDGPWSIEQFADDVAALMQALGLKKAHVSGLSLGAAVGMWLAAKHPDMVKSLSVHAGWTKTDYFLATVVRGWQMMARAVGVQEATILGLFPWCFTSELYATRPEFVQGLCAFVRNRPAQPVAAFIQQSDAVLAHDCEAQLARIGVPTQVTCGRHDRLTSVEAAERIHRGIRGSELTVFEGCGHASIYESVEEFNGTTLAFLKRCAG
jgi:3-oxoadipate enol-lactonase